MRGVRSLCALALFVGVVFYAGGAAAKDRHIGYYYPDPGKPEVYKARAKTLQGMDRPKRLEFVNSMVAEMLARPYPLPAAVFAKGTDAEKLMIVSNFEGRLNTVYRARALLATLTATARTLPILKEYNVQDLFTFLDLLKVLGFKQVTVSDGKDFAHQILLE